MTKQLPEPFTGERVRALILQYFPDHAARILYLNSTRDPGWWHSLGRIEAAIWALEDSGDLAAYALAHAFSWQSSEEGFEYWDALAVGAMKERSLANQILIRM